MKNQQTNPPERRSAAGPAAAMSDNDARSGDFGAVRVFERCCGWASRGPGASQFLNTGRGRPVNPQPRTAALRSVGVLARELRHRLGALLKLRCSATVAVPAAAATMPR